MMSFFSPGKIRTKIISFFVAFFFLIESVFLPIAMFAPRLASAQTSTASASSLDRISSSGSISQKLHYAPSSNSFYGIGSDNAIWKWDNSAKQWSRITDGSIKDDFHFITESDIYGIGMDNQIWHWNGIRWSQTSEGGKIQHKIWYIDGNHIYGIGMDNQVWRWGSAGGWVQITSNGQIKDDFTLINNSENNIYGIGLDNNVWHWNGVSWSRVTMLPGQISQRLVVVSPDLMYGIGLDNRIWKWSDTAGWSQIAGSGQVKDDFTLINNSENNIYGIGLDGQIWKWSAASTSTTPMVSATSTSVNLKVNNSDGPLSLSPGATAVVSWSSQGFQTGDSCSASGAPAGSSFSGSSIPVSGSAGVVFASAGNYTLQITCFRGLRTTEAPLTPSASDSVIMNVGSVAIISASGGEIQRKIQFDAPNKIYAINLDNEIWKWDGTAWSSIAPGGQIKDDFTLINNSENNIYGIGLDNNVWHWNGVSWSRVTMLPGQISQRLVVVSPDLMYGIGLDNRIWKWSDTAGWSQIAGSGQVKDDFTLINNSENNIYGIGLDNNVWHWNGVSWSRVTMLPGQISQRLVVVSPDLMYGIGLDNKIWKWSGTAGWSQIAGSGQVKDDFTLINNSENNIYGIGLDNNVWHWNGTSWQSIGAAISQQIVQPGDYKKSITIDGRERTYLLHIPTGYSVSKKYPLVAVFHGGGSAGAQVAQHTGFLEYADKESFIAVFPDGIANNWNDGRDTTDAYKAGADDVKFIRTLVEHLNGKLLIDNDRIFATGMSNGGIFSHRLACEMSDVFAAIGSDVGAIASNLVSKCSPPKPISIVAIQGIDDPFQPINGGDTTHKTLGIGDGGLVESAENTRKFWAGKNNCSNTPKKEALPVTIQDGTSVEKTTDSGCRNNTEVVYYIVNGMGHAWPPKALPLKVSVVGKTSHNIDATKTFWNFFKQHPKAGVSSSAGTPPPAGRIAPTPTTAPMATLTLQREQEKVLPDQPVSFSGILDSSLVAFPQGTSIFIAIPEKTEVQSLVIDGRTLGVGEFSVQNGGVKISFSQSLYEGSHSFRIVLRNAASSIPQLDRNVAIWITVVDANNKLLLKGRTASTQVAHLPTEVIGRGFSLSVPNTVTGRVGEMANCCWFSADKTHFIIREFGFGAMDITRGPFWTPNQIPILPENIAFTLFPADASMQSIGMALNQFSEPLAREFITAGYQYILGRDPSNEEMSRYLPRFIQWRNPLISLAEVYQRRSDVRQAIMVPRDRHIGGDNDGSPRPSWDKLLEWAALYGWREEASLRPYKLQTGFDDGWRRFQELWNGLGVDPYHENYRELLESNANVDPLWTLAYLCEKSNQSRNHRLSSEVVDFEFCWKNDQIVRHKAILWAKDRMIFGPGEYQEEFAEEQTLRYPPAQLYFDLLSSSEYAAFLQNRFRDNIDSVWRLFFGRPASANDVAWVKNKFLGGDYSFTNPDSYSFGYDHTRSWMNEYWEPNGVLVASNFDYRVSEEFIKNQTFILDDVYGIRHTAGEIDAVSARLLEVIERLGRKELYEGDNFKRIVSGLYRLYVRRNPTDAEIDQHRASGKNFGDIEMSLNQSREYGKDPASADAIKNLYRNYLGKDPSNSEIASWSGKTISFITQEMGKSAEMKALAQQHPENAYIFPIKRIKMVKCGFFCSVFGKIVGVALNLIPGAGQFLSFAYFGIATGTSGGANVTGAKHFGSAMQITLNSISRGFNEAGFNGETFVQWISIARAMAGQAGGVFSMTNLFENADQTVLDGFRTMARAPQAPQSGSFAQTESQLPRYGLASLADAFSGYFGMNKQSGQPTPAPRTKLAQIDISSRYGGGSAGGGVPQQKSASARQAKLMFAKTLSRGSRGDEVLRLQKILGEIDLTFLPEYRTGYYGPKTESAVKIFQKQNGLEAVGYVGPKTRALLNSIR